ncbi:hypothetical protein [Azospirillum brasilense]|uniref:hypothetical protein n=1 Tax=Azospirillum brasilense TaxID=192 RepID=UPI0011C3F901|nr:hypothetical protein [Azospirillum brasilense]NUB24330.1 hypothetical protein [Azospirillum brasilense]
MEEETYDIYMLVNLGTKIDCDHVNDDFLRRNCSGMTIMAPEQFHSDPICTRLIRPYLVQGIGAEDISVIAGRNSRAPTAIVMRAQKRFVGALLLPQDCRSSILSYLNIADGIVNEQNRRQRGISEELRDLEGVRRLISSTIDRHQFIAQPLRCAVESIDMRLAELRSTSYLTFDEVMKLAEALMGIQRALVGKWRLPSTSHLPKAEEFAPVYAQHNIHKSLKTELLQVLFGAQVR